MCAQDAILRASIKKDGDPTLSMGGTLCRASGKDRLFPGERKTLAGRAGSPPGKQVVPGGLLAHGTLEHPEDGQPLPRDAGTRAQVGTTSHQLGTACSFLYR